MITFCQFEFNQRTEMPLLQVSKKLFKQIVRDVSNIEKTFACSYIDCDLTSERLIITAESTTEKNKVKISHTYFSGGISEKRKGGGDRGSCLTKPSLHFQPSKEVVEGSEAQKIKVGGVTESCLGKSSPHLQEEAERLEENPETGGDCRRVPKEFSSKLKVIEEIVLSEDSPLLKFIYFGMEKSNFFLKVKCCDWGDYLLGKIKPEPDCIVYI